MQDTVLRAFFVALVTLLGVLPATTVQAQSTGGLRFSGYGTLGYVQDNRNDIVAIRDVSQRPDSNMGSGTWQRDSRLGIQAEYRVNPVVDLVAQAVFRDQVSTHATHAIELAYAGFKPTPQLDVRVGRVGYDAFLMSDIRNVGYAYPWVRPFTEYYGWIPLFSVDGADIAYLIPQGDAQWRLKAQAGRSGLGIPIGDSKLDVKADGLVTLTVSRRTGPWEAKLGYSSFTNRNEVAPGGGGGLAALQQGLDTIATATASLAPAISSEATDLRRQLSFKNAHMNYVTLGAVYDDGHLLIQGELARTTSSHKVVPHGTMGYVAIGYRTGDWTPFMAVSATRPGNGLRSAKADWSVIGQSATQATAIAVLNSTRMDQKTLSFGTRWDFQERAALKVQWDITRIDPHGYGLVFKDPALETRRSSMNQLTLTLDFLF